MSGDSEQDGNAGKKKAAQEHDLDALHYALESAIEFLRMEEWQEDDGGLQVRAYREMANRIERRRRQLVR